MDTFKKKITEIESMAKEIQNNFQYVEKIDLQNLKTLEGVQLRLKEEKFGIKDLNKLHQVFSQLCEKESEDDGFRRWNISPRKDNSNQNNDGSNKDIIKFIKNMDIQKILDNIITKSQFKKR